MGQFNTKLNKSYSQPTEVKNIFNFDIKVEKIDVSIDKKPIQIDEKSKGILKYKTPHFRYEVTKLLYFTNIFMKKNPRF
jgi:hypothetical protein